MMKTGSASNISVVVDAGNSCPQSMLPSTAEKRNHAEIGGGSHQSPPPPSEKRNRVEIVQQPLKSSPSPPAPIGKENRCKCGGIGEREKMTFDKLPADAKERYLKVKESFGALWDELNMGSHYASDELIGDIGFLGPDPDPEPDQNSLGCEADEGTMNYFGA